jgi:hypothetical protein
MRFIILLGLLAVALPFIISQTAASYGNAVSERFLERPTAADPRYTVPPDVAQGPELTVDSLTNWVRNHVDPAKGYVARVIPLDILYLVFLGTFLGLASTTLAGTIRWPSVLEAVPTLIWWVLPALYIVSDFVEDSMIFTMLNWPSNIQDLFNTLGNVRAVKIWSVGLGMAQVLVLSILSFVLVPAKI